MKTPRYCKKHRSHFCPCVASERYRDPVTAKVDWDKAETEYRAKKEHA